MKNYLDYYYNILPNDIHFKNNKYYFEKDGYLYIIFEYKEELKKLQNAAFLCEYLNNNGLYCNVIVKTIQNQLYCLINEKKFVLIKYLKYLERKISIQDIINFNYYIDSQYLKKYDCSDWKTLWETKMTYFEYQLNQFGYNLDMLKNTYSYFSGYVELAIVLLNNNKNNFSDILSINHKRLSVNSTLYDLYDPLNMVIDCKARDYAEFWKSILMNNDLNNGLDDLNKKEVIKKILFTQSKQDAYLFFVRMLYPSFYFDKFEFVMNHFNDKEICSDDIFDNIFNNIEKIISKYEGEIKKLYKVLFQMKIVPYIEWLK